VHGRSSSAGLVISAAVATHTAEAQSVADAIDVQPVLQGQTLRGFVQVSNIRYAYVVIPRGSGVVGRRLVAGVVVAKRAGVGWAPILAGGRRRVQLIGADEVARVLLAAATRPELAGRRGFAAGPPLEMGELAEYVASLRRPPARRIRVPAVLTHWSGAARTPGSGAWRFTTACSN